MRKAAGLPNFRFHDLRHTFNTQGTEAGVPVEVLMAQVGHIDPAMSRHYTHISSGAKQQAARLIENRNSRVLALLQAVSQSKQLDN